MNEKLRGYAAQLFQRTHDVSKSELSQKCAVEVRCCATGVVNCRKENVVVEITQVAIEERGLAGAFRAAKDHEAVGLFGGTGEVRHQQGILHRVKDLRRCGQARERCSIQSKEIEILRFVYRVLLRLWHALIPVSYYYFPACCRSSRSCNSYSYIGGEGFEGLFGIKFRENS